ncbi:MAG: M56 family metallopeptidase [Opitutales bacterium]
MIPLLAESALKGTAILAVATALILVLRPSSAARRYAIWFSALAGLLLLPLLNQVVPGYQVIPRAELLEMKPMGMVENEERAQSPTVSNVPEQVPSPLAEWPRATEKVPVAKAPVFSWNRLLHLLPWIWLAGGAFAAAPFFFGYAGLRRLAARAIPIEQGREVELKMVLMEAIGLHCRVRLLRGPRGAMPMTWGMGLWGPPVILLPREAREWSDERIRTVLLHELAHVQRRDCLNQFLGRCACVLYWFHPWVWIAASRMLVEREKACDDVVLRHSNSPSGYARDLVEVASHADARFLAGRAGIAMARPNKLDSRLRAILDHQRSRAALTRWVLTGLVSLTALVALPVASLQWAASPGEQATGDEAKGRAEGESGTPIGGMIVDDAGNPILGATVVVRIQKRANGSIKNVESTTLKTGFGGLWEWRYRAAPEEVDQIVVGFHHPDYVSHAPGDSSYILEPFDSLAELRAGAKRVLERGVKIEGIVLDAAGEPAEGATIGFGADRMMSNKVPERRADAEGHFSLPVRPDEEVILTVRHPGHAPELVRGLANELSDPIRVQLSPGRTLTGQVVDAEGDPVPSVRVWMDTWRETRTLGVRLHTDSDGRFEWNDAPEDIVLADFWASAYPAKRGVPVQAGRENRIELAGPPVVRGKIVDAETGLPIRRFDVATPGNWFVSDEPPQPINWERDASRTFDVENGSFELEVSGSYHLWAIRIEAEGYELAQSPIFAIEDGNQDLAFELEPAKWAVGRVSDNAGSPVSGADIFLVQRGGSLEMIDGAIDHTRNVLQEVTGPGGRFSFPPQDNPFLLVVRHESGYAELSGTELAEAGEVVLQPWARIQGKAKIRGAPAAGHEIFSRYSQRATEANAYVSYELRTSADAEGEFAFERVPPGEVRLGRMEHDGTSPWVIRTVHQNPINLQAEAGEVTSVSIGGTGRPIVGSVSVEELSGVEWNAPVAEVIRQNARESVASQRIQYGFVLQSNGSFRIEDLDSGDYSLRIKVREGPPHYRTLASVTHDFSIPEFDGLYIDEPLELPVLELEWQATE